MDSVDVNGHPRKTLTCTLEFKLGIYENSGIALLIEGIGDVHSMFPIEAPNCDDDYISGLRCYEDSIVGFYHHNPEYDDCELVRPSVSTSEENPDNDIQVFPNPSSGKVYFSNPELEYLTIEVVSLQGKILKKEQGFISEITLHQIPPGIYTLRFVNLKGEIFVKKLVKQ